MSAQTQAGWGSTEQVDTPIPMTRLVVVEMRKMLDTRAGLWLLIVIVALTTLVVGAVAVLGDEEASLDVLLLVAATPQGLLLPVLGVLLVTSEWGQRAAMTTFVLVPRRERVVAAKVVAAILIGLAVLAVTFLVAAVAALVSGAELGDSEPRIFGHVILLQVMGILQGLAFGLVLLNSAAAIVSFYLVPIVFSVLVNVSDSLREAAPWIDLGTAQGPLSESGALTGTEWTQLLSAAAIWILLPLALGSWRMVTAEVK